MKIVEYKKGDLNLKFNDVDLLNLSESQVREFLSDLTLLHSKKTDRAGQDISFTLSVQDNQHTITVEGDEVKVSQEEAYIAKLMEKYKSSFPKVNIEYLDFSLDLNYLEKLQVLLNDGEQDLDNLDFDLEKNVVDLIKTKFNLEDLFSTIRAKSSNSEAIKKYKEEHDSRDDLINSISEIITRKGKVDQKLANFKQFAELDISSIKERTIDYRINQLLLKVKQYARNNILRKDTKEEDKKKIFVGAWVFMFPVFTILFGLISFVFVNQLLILVYILLLIPQFFLIWLYSRIRPTFVSNFDPIVISENIGEEIDTNLEVVKSKSVNYAWYKALEEEKRVIDKTIQEQLGGRSLVQILIEKILYSRQIVLTESSGETKDLSPDEYINKKTQLDSISSELGAYRKDPDMDKKIIDFETALLSNNLSVDSLFPYIFVFSSKNESSAVKLLEYVKSNQNKSQYIFISYS